MNQILLEITVITGKQIRDLDNRSLNTGWPLNTESHNAGWPLILNQASQHLHLCGFKNMQRDCQWADFAKGSFAATPSCEWCHHVLLLLDCSSCQLQNQTLCIERETAPPPQEPSWDVHSLNMSFIPWMCRLLEQCQCLMCLTER